VSSEWDHSGKCEVMAKRDSRVETHNRVSLKWPGDWLARKRFTYRWRRAYHRWPIERFLPTTDLNLTRAELAEFKQGLDDWRLLVPRYLARFGYNEHNHIYCFGAAQGGTLSKLVDGFRRKGMAIPHMHLFDSFLGLPEENPGVKVPPIWNVGAFAVNPGLLEYKIRTLELPQGSYTVHNGWFESTLKAEHIESGTFKPAVYVDIDADLCRSTVDALDFMFGRGLIQAGTLIGYDDWGDTDLWTADESRAHKEITQKYGAQCAQLFSWGEPPLIRKLFLVVGA
jgi:Macrocin-O-methyltransferase (TylF)